jgi:hypothetical protein
MIIFSYNIYNIILIIIIFGSSIILIIIIFGLSIFLVNIINIGSIKKTLVF